MSTNAYMYIYVYVLHIHNYNYSNKMFCMVIIHSGRQVVGLEVILGALAHARSQQKQLNKLQILDAGI